MNQLDLIDMIERDARRRARRTDPHTSHAAAEQAGSIANQHQKIIWEYLDAIFPRSAIVDEIAKGTKLTPYQASKRMKELSEANRIRWTGDTRKGKSGRAQRCWVSA